MFHLLGPHGDRFSAPGLLEIQGQLQEPRPRIANPSNQQYSPSVLSTLPSFLDGGASTSQTAPTPPTNGWR